MEDTRPRGEGVGEEEVTGGGICGAVGPAWPLISSTHPCRKLAQAGTWEVSTKPIHHPEWQESWPVATPARLLVEALSSRTGRQLSR